jgi:hypothetical protein
VQSPCVAGASSSYFVVVTRDRRPLESMAILILQYVLGRPALFCIRKWGERNCRAAADPDCDCDDTRMIMRNSKGSLAFMA